MSREGVAGVGGSEGTPRRRPGRPRLERPSADYLRRREEIIDAAAKVFRERGYEAGTLDDVASALHMHPATLYHYIQSKSQLLSLVCARVINVILEALEEIRRIEDPTERMFGLVRCHVDAVIREQGVFKVFLDDQASLQKRDRAAIHRLERRYLAAVINTAEAAMEAGLLPHTDPYLSGQVLLGSLTWVYKWFDPKRHDARAYADACVTLLLRGQAEVAAHLTAVHGETRVDFGLPGAHLSHGDHVCAFYHGPRERDEILISYLEAGLRSGDKCICIVDSVAPEEVRAKLHKDPNAATAPPQLELLSTSQADYLRDGVFQADVMLDFWERTVSAAVRNDGFRFVRIVGEMCWALRDVPGVEELVPYESQVNRFAIRYPQVLLCLYDLDQFSGDIILGVLKTHPKVLAGGTVVANPHYIHPDQFLAAAQ
jgi:AcrR family transcriptional regulator